LSTPRLKLSFENFGMKADRLLLPIDLPKCPMEIFPLANGFTKPFEGKIILLHVLDPRLDRRRKFTRESNRQQAERYLVRIGQHLNSTVETCFRVRIGIPHEEIFAEASAAQADLILLPVFMPSIWRRIFGPRYGETARSVIAGSSIRVFVVDVRSRFNCLRHWAREESSGKWAA
jgi:nucleotide-binding universal stress UspA family protein